MNNIILISGGARSGKSLYAEKLGEKYEKLLYIATSVPFDDEMAERVKIHLSRRPITWKTVEEYSQFSKLSEMPEFRDSDCILLDCITIMISNIMLEVLGDDEIDIESGKEIERICMENIKDLIDLCRKTDKKLIMVTNEVGLGIVPENRMARIFRDIAGKVNSYAAELSEEVYLVFMGIPNRIK